MAVALMAVPLMAVPLIRLAPIGSRAAATTTGAALLQLLLQVQHHPPWVLLQPFAGPHAIQGKGRQHRRRRLGGRVANRHHQIRAEAGHQPIQPLLQREMARKRKTVEPLDQQLQPALPQRVPPRLAGQGRTPLAHLLATDPRRCWFSRCGAGWGGIITPARPPQPLQLAGQAQHLPPQSFVLGQ